MLPDPILFSKCATCFSVFLESNVETIPVLTSSHRVDVHFQELILKSGIQPPKSHQSYHTCLSRNSRASFSMWPSYKLVVRLIRPILESPKSVSLMCPMDVIRRLLKSQKQKYGVIFWFSKNADFSIHRISPPWS